MPHEKELYGNHLTMSFGRTLKTIQQVSYITDFYFISSTL